MPTALQLRAQIEATLAERIPSALSPAPRVANPVEATGIAEMDRLLCGGFPVGALSEIVGPECSGRTSLALTFVARMTQAGKVCAWVDVSDTLHPESAAAVGVDLGRLLWIRCGVQQTPPAAPTLLPEPVRSYRITEKPTKVKPGLPQAGGGHPRMEAKGLSAAVNHLLGGADMAACCAEPTHKPRPEPKKFVAQERVAAGHTIGMKTAPRSKAWSRLEQALRVMDLLLQGGGFSCIVLDMGGLHAEFALRVPLATWFRFRSAAERQQSHVLLLTQYACSRNSAGLVLRLEAEGVTGDDSPVFTGIAHRAELARQRFAPSQETVVSLRKPPQRVNTAEWHNNAVWAGRR
jgi:hypothetical protein